MSLIYVIGNGSTVGIRGGSIVIENEEEKDDIPKETVEGISFFG